MCFRPVLSDLELPSQWTAESQKCACGSNGHSQSLAHSLSMFRQALILMDVAVSFRYERKECLIIVGGPNCTVNISMEPPEIVHCIHPTQGSGNYMIQLRCIRRQFYTSESATPPLANPKSKQFLRRDLVITDSCTSNKEMLLLIDSITG